MHTAQAPAYTQVPSYTYLPALDGIRAIAILLVICAHFGLEKFVPGGFGVTLFFFISGFLISRQLACELSSTSKIDYIAFYMRRITRLMPALVIMIIVSGSLFVFWGGEISTTQVVSAFLYAANYYDLYAMYHSNLPGVRHPFIILWSLAVEEHFYILFPVFFAVIYPRSKYPIPILVLLLIAALAWRLTLWNICSEDSLVCGLRGTYRFYKSTDTRFDSILFGVLLTVIFARSDLHALKKYLTGNIVFVLALSLLVLTFVIRNDFFRETYRYSLQGLALIALLAATLFSPAFSRLHTFLSLPPLLLIGRWSYSLYLYHWVGLMIGDELVAAHKVSSVYPAAAITMILLSLASYYGIERPALAWRKRFGSHAR